MMKKYLTIVCSALLSGGSLCAQETYFTTGFDAGIPSSFTLYDNDGRIPSADMRKLGFDIGIPWVALPEEADGNMVACSTSWYKNAGKSDDWMILPSINVDSEKAVLSWRSRASDKDYRDGFAVYISEKGNSISDFDVDRPLYSVSQEKHEWNKHSVSLKDYKGKAVYIAFVNNSKDKNRLFLDDIFVGVPSCVGITLDFDRVIRSYGSMNMSGKVYPTDGKDHAAYTLGYCINGEKVEQTYTATLRNGEETPFVMDTPFSIERNQTIDYSAWIKCDGDSSGIRGKVSAYPLKLVSEEVTGTWCGYCVRGIVAMKTMNDKYPDNFIGIAIHNSTPHWPDAMAEGVEDYLEYIYTSCKISGYPHCVFSRNPMYSIDPAYMEQYYKMLMDGDGNSCGVQLTATYDATDNKIDATTDVYFAADADNADYKLAYVLVENNVHRTAKDLGLEDGQPTGYEQNNYYAGTETEMGGFEDMPSTVPAEQMWYNDVARGIWPDSRGMGGIIPASVRDGDSYKHTYSIGMPSNVLEPKNTELVVMLLDKNGIIVNADKVKIQGLTAGISGTTRQPAVSNDAAYGINGVRMAGGAKGILIHNGRKTIRR